jgi:ribosomal protein S18 acetylase RimI-like enzyme
MTRTVSRPATEAAPDEPDLVASLGELALASRLKRLSDRLYRDVARVYHGLDVDFEPRWFPLLQALRPGQSLAITELARRLGQTHAAINQLAAEMGRGGLVLGTSDPRDRRRRLLRLSVKGHRLGERLGPIWEEIREANRRLLSELRAQGCDLLGSIAAAERALDARDMHARVLERLGERRDRADDFPTDRLEIQPYRPAWRRYFGSLNREWLDRLFEIEPHDAGILADPYGTIVKNGGAVFFARLDSRIVGTGALIHHSGGTYEIAKMAVSRDQRRRGIGTRLVRALLAEARARKARTVFLETSPRLISARRWYQRLGFRKSHEHPLGGSPYRRRSIVMLLEDPDHPAARPDRLRLVRRTSAIQGPRGKRRKP